MGDPQPVYKNGVLIGYTYDGKSMTPVNKGAQEVYDKDKFIGITYDGKTMTPFEQPEPVKKKEVSGQGFWASQSASVPQSTSTKEVSPEIQDLLTNMSKYTGDSKYSSANAVTTAASNLAAPRVQVAAAPVMSKDPIKDALGKINQKIDLSKNPAVHDEAGVSKPIDYQIVQKQADISDRVKQKEDNKKALDAYNYVHKNMGRQLFPTTIQAQNFINQHANEKNNTTLEAAKGIVNENNAIDEALYKNNGDIASAALDYFSKEDSREGEVLRRMIKDGANIDDNTKGELALSLLNHPHIQELASQNQEIHNEVMTQKQGIYQKFPSLRARDMLSEVSAERESNGDNNWFYNNPSPDKIEKTANKLVDEGKWTRFDLDFFNKEVLPKIAVGAVKLKSPGVIENFEQSLGSGALNTLAAVGQPFRSLFRSKGEQLAQDLQQEKSEVATPKYSFKHRMSSATGNLGGAIATMVGTGGVLKGLGLVSKAATADELGVGLSMFHDYYKEELKNHPDNQKMAYLSAILQSTVMAKFNKFLPKIGRDAMQKASPEVNAVLESLEKKEINNQIAASQLAKIFTRVYTAAKETVTPAVQMSAAGMANDVISGVLGGRFNVDASINKAANTFEELVLGGAALGIMRNVMPKATLTDFHNEVVKNKDEVRRMIDERAKSDPEFAAKAPEMLENLDHLVKVNEALKNRTDLSEKDKAKFQSLSLQQINHLPPKKK